MSASRLWILMVREVTELSRDHVSLVTIFAFPCLLLAIYAYVLATDVRGMELAVLDGANSADSRELVSSLARTDYFRVSHVATRSEATRRMAKGEIGALLVIRPGGEKELSRGGRTEVALVLDGAETSLAANTESIVRAVLASVDARRGALDGSARSEPAAAIRVEATALFNPRLASEPYMVPGALGFVLTFVTILTAAIAIVRERATGTFEQLLLTPVTQGEIVVAKLLVLGGVMLANAGSLMVIGGLCFGTWPRASFLVIVPMTCIYISISLLLGLAVSFKATTTTGAIQHTLSVTTLLNICGHIMPVSCMPDWARHVASVLPFTHYMRAMRVAYVTDAGMDLIASDVGVLGAYAMVAAAALGWITRRRGT